jgi:hypothetical protein
MARRKGVDTAPLPPERSERAQLLRPFVDQRVTLVWAMGCQQTKHIIKGTLAAVTDRYAELRDTVPTSAGNQFRCPLAFLVRFESEDFAGDAAAPVAAPPEPLEYDPAARPAAILTDSARMYLAEQERDRTNEQAVADLKAAANVPYAGNRLDNLPPGQKCTWHQWCGNAGHPGDERSGEAWAAYLSGVTGGQYRKQQRKQEAKETGGVQQI